MKFSDVLPPRSVLNPLLKEMANSPYIALVEWDDLHALANYETVRFCYEADDLIGIGAWQELNENWCELGPFYVVKAHRGKEYGKSIIKRIMTLTQSCKHYAVTKNPAAKHIFAKNGLREVNPLHLPPIIRNHLSAKASMRRIGTMLRKANLQMPTHYISDI